MQRGTMFMCAGNLAETIKKKEQMKPHAQNVSSKVLLNLNQIQRYSSSSAENLNFVLDNAC